MPQKDALLSLLWGLKRTLIHAALFSGLVNILLLAPSLYMMQVNDRVLMSRNMDTLFWLTVLAIYLYVMMGLMEWLRHELMTEFSNQLSAVLDTRVYDAAYRRSLAYGGNFLPQAMHDLQGLKTFITSESVYIILDLPWLPFALIAIFMVQPVMGIMSVLSTLTLLAITLLAQRQTSRPIARSNELFSKANTYVSTHFSNAEIMAALGMLPDFCRRWLEKHRESLKYQAEATNATAGFNALSKLVRIGSQSLMIAIGMLLSFSVDPTITPGSMIIGSMLLGRALAPLDMATMLWSQLHTNALSFARIRELLNQFPELPVSMPMPKPEGRLTLTNVFCSPPGSRIQILHGISFHVDQGQTIGIVGPSASGKSTLARMVVGLWPAASGHIRLDGADIYQLDRIRTGPHIGYLPQDVALFDGTIGQNISRFGKDDPERLHKAAIMTGVIEIIDALPDGYDTLVSQQGGLLSAGQKQRIALARAVYGAPALVVMDEPNSNLDQLGERALEGTLRSLQSQGATVLLISHSRDVLQYVDKILWIEAGRVKQFVDRDVFWEQQAGRAAKAI